MMWGCDEMWLAALVVGCRAAIGSTYNIASPLYHRIQVAFDEGRLAEAAELQAQAVAMVKMIYAYPFHSAMKAFSIGSASMSASAVCLKPHSPNPNSPN